MTWHQRIMSPPPRSSSTCAFSPWFESNRPHESKIPAGTELMRRLRDIVDRVAPGHPSPIVPIVMGDEQSTIAASRALLERGYFVPTIRPPSVAPGNRTPSGDAVGGAHRGTGRGSARRAARDRGSYLRWLGWWSYPARVPRSARRG